ncbi:MAG TPA: EAL domain-containing protein [Burkholderiales bacterium]|nr:EAL domain-containing protein [Burkholderiales bacterium]
MEAIIRTAFQPIMSDRGNVVAYEALLRFREGLDKPDSREVMIRRWEDCGYISTIDVSVLKQASAALGMLHNSLLVSVNVSMVTLSTDRDRYLRHLDSLGDKAKKLIVEVTNTASESDPTVLLKFARECAARNVRLALDDFVPDRPKAMETVLQLIRPKLIKLDRKAVSVAFQTVQDGQIRELVKAAAAVNSRVVAQGIDSQEKLDWAFGLGVRYFQGFLVGHPRQLPLLDTQASFRDIEDSVMPEEIAA